MGSDSNTKKHWNFCNIAIKYLLFMINTAIWVRDSAAVEVFRGDGDVACL